MKMINKTIDIQKLIEENDNLKGTKEYFKYHMECSCYTNGRWHFVGWGIPYTCDCTIKKVKDNHYIMSGNKLDNNLTRYKVSEEVNKLLEIY